MKVIHHNDNDGRCAAFLFYKWAQTEKRSLEQSDFIEMDYSKELPMKRIERGESVYFLDYHPQDLQQYKWLAENTCLCIIDHHKTTIPNLSEMNKHTTGYATLFYREDQCGAMLVANKLLGLKNIPKFIQYVDDWDRWVLRFKESKLFNAGTRLLDTSPFAGIWEDLWEEREDPDLYALRSVLNRGQIALLYSENMEKEVVKRTGFATSLDGYPCFVINQSCCNSTWFDSVPFDGIYAAISFNGKVWKVSLYSQFIDVSEIASKHGGGGHKGAAGFVCEKLPFTKII